MSTIKERPHFVFKEGRYYLFTTSHKYTFSNGVTGPDGVYGFVARKMTGPYTPMNASGLVLKNPLSQPYQTYSHYLMPNGLVTSFIDSVSAENRSYRIGGTEAPTLGIVLKGQRSFIDRFYDYGYIPAMKDVRLK